MQQNHLEQEALKQAAEKLKSRKKKPQLQQVLVWDIPTRLFHWLLVIGVAYAWFAVEILEDMEQHFYAGYSVLCLLLFRLVWGFVGSRYVRFKSFLYSPVKIIAYVKNLPNRPSIADTIEGGRQEKLPAKTSTKYLGHNPLGGLAVFVMLAVLIFQTGSGLFSSDDYYYGPLAGLIDKSLVARLTNLHHLNFDIITAVIAIHIIAILFYHLYKKDHLVGAMFHGKKFHGKFNDKKPVDETSDDKKPVSIDPSITGSRLVLAVFVLAICIVAVYLLANSFTDSLPSAEDYYSYKEPSASDIKSLQRQI